MFGWDDVLAAAPAAVSLFNGVMGANSQSDTNAANQANAREQMDFQERMSSSAHQREVSDLIKAGLNPILSVSRGASSPSGAMSVAQSPYQAGINAASGASSTALNYAHSALANQQKATEVEHTAQQKVETEQAGWIHANIDKVMTAKLAQMVDSSELTNLQAQAARAALPKIQIEIENLAKAGKLLDADTALANIQATLHKLQVPEANSFATFFSSAIGKAVPYVREASGVVSSAAKATAAGAVVNRLRR